MKDYKPLFGKSCLYKGVSCRIIQVPQNKEWIPDFTLMPSKAIDDIGAGKGRQVRVSAMEFEIECTLIKRED